MREGQLHYRLSRHTKQTLTGKKRRVTEKKGLKVAVVIDRTTKQSTKQKYSWIQQSYGIQLSQARNGIASSNTDETFDHMKVAGSLKPHSPFPYSCTTIISLLWCYTNRVLSKVGSESIYCILDFLTPHTRKSFTVLNNSQLPFE